MKQYRTLALFFFVTFLGSWSVWFTTIAQNNKHLSFHIPQALAFWFGLFIITYLVALLTGGLGAAKDLLHRAFRWKVGRQAYAIAVLLPVLIALAAYIISAIFGKTPQIGVDVAAASLPFVILMELWLFMMTEETAWRGFALPRLQNLMSPLRASIVLGVIWSIWHIPLFLITDSFQSTIPYVGFAISTIATSVTLVWLFNNSRGSVLITAIFHTFADVSIVYFGVMSSTTVFWITVSLQVLVGVWAGRQLRVKPLTRTSDYIYN